MCPLVSDRRPEDPEPASDVGRFKRGARGELIVRPHAHQHALLGERHNLRSRLMRGQRDDGGIDAAGCELFEYLICWGNQRLNAACWKEPAIGPFGDGQDSPVRGDLAAQPHAPGHPAMGLPQLFQRLFMEFENGLCVIEELEAACGGARAVGVTEEERRAKTVFEFAHPFADRGLGHKERVRRPCEAAMIEDSNEVAKVP